MTNAASIASTPLMRINNSAWIGAMQSGRVDEETRTQEAQMLPTSFWSTGSSRATTEQQQSNSISGSRCKVVVAACIIKPNLALRLVEL